MKLSARIWLVLLTFLFFGCSHVTYMGQIGKVKIYGLQKTSLLGPSITAIALQEGADIHLTQTYSGNGWVPAVTGGGATVAGAFLWGSSLRPDRTSVQQGTTVNEQTAVTVPAPAHKPLKMNHHDD